MNINQKESPEAYREYMKAYQRIWRAKHRHYYRDRARMKKNNTLTERYDMTDYENDIKEIKEILNRMQESIYKIVNNTEPHPQTSQPHNTEESIKIPSTQACSQEELLKDMM